MEKYGGEQVVKTRKIEYKEDRFEDICSIQDDLSEDVLDKNLISREANLRNNIWEHLQPNQLCIKKAQGLSQEITNNFEIKFLESWSSENKDKNTNFSKETINYILTNDYLTPQFDLITDKQRGRLINKIGLKHQHVGDSVILTFKLPKILLGSEEDEDLPQEIIDFRDKRGKRWIYLYQSLMQIIWENIRKYKDEGEVSIQRLNPKKQHDIEGFYYIWKIRGNKINKEENVEVLNETTLNNNQQHP